MTCRGSRRYRRPLATNRAEKWRNVKPRKARRLFLAITCPHYPRTSHPVLPPSKLFHRFPVDPADRGFLVEPVLGQEVFPRQPIELSTRKSSRLRLSSRTHRRSLYERLVGSITPSKLPALAGGLAPCSGQTLSGYRRSPCPPGPVVLHRAARLHKGGPHLSGKSFVARGGWTI